MSLKITGLNKTIDLSSTTLQGEASNEIKIQTDAGVTVVTIGSDGSIDIATGAKIKVNGQAVVGGRLAAVAAPAGGATVDAEARAAIALIIARMKVTGGHGLIAD